jgi:crotonobetainyl-CoA:carnitine CoA-transferase CaiB-like acyl-CoA transferase
VTKPTLPLAGVRVIEIASAIAGPAATRHMSDFGAEVVKIESRAHPDPARLAGPPGRAAPGLDNSGYFAAYNAGKLSMALDLKHPAANSVMRRFVEVCDVLVEAHRPGVMRRLGLDWKTIHAWNPKLIMASHSLLGQSGPYASLGGFGQLVDALSGWFDMTGEADAEPTGMFSAHSDFVSWPYLLTAILLALEMREVTGRGTYIDHAQLESVAYFSAPELLLVAMGRPVQRDGNHEGQACPNNTYRCRGHERWCAMTIGSDMEWQRLCNVLEVPGLAADRRFYRFSDRKRNEPQLDAEIAAQTAQWDARELAMALVDHGIAAAEVYRAEDLFSDPQLVDRRAFHELEQPLHGPHRVLAPSIRIEGIQAGPSAGYPALGEHTQLLCRDWLGMSETEFEEYERAGAFV